MHMSEFRIPSEAPLARHVRDAIHRHRPARDVNVGDMERAASLIGGGGLMLYGLTRGTLGGVGLALLGGALIYRGTTGQCAGYKALGINTTQSRGPRNSVAAQHGARVDER